MQPIPAFSLATKISGLACPRCTSTAFHKYGRHLGIQRYRCTCCGRTFNETVNTPLHGIHDKKKMIDYLVTMQDQQSIRAASKQLGISIPTSFSWRHRILSSMREENTAPTLSPAGICEIRLPHSSKGKPRAQNKKMPETHSLLISNASGVPCLRLLTKTNRTFEAALLITNSLRPAAQIQAAKTNLISRATSKIQLHKTLNKAIAKYLSKQALDTAGKLTDWMARFRGVATKYLQQYWDWFRAESNFLTFDQFRTQCFGTRQLARFRQIALAQQ